MSDMRRRNVEMNYIKLRYYYEKVSTDVNCIFTQFMTRLVCTVNVT